MKSELRWLEPVHHPLLRSMDREEVFDHGRFMAPGGLLLVDLAATAIGLAAGDRVLDLGCGRGQSSIWMASQYGAEVVSVDLWVGTGERNIKAEAAGVASRITALQGDIRRGMPQGTAPFDSIVAVQSFHSFGTNPAVLRYLATLLRPGGRFVIAQTCFNNAPKDMPAVFLDAGGRYTEYEKYHDPAWWSAYLGSTGDFSVDLCEELRDGDVFWEDDVLTRGARVAWHDAFIKQNAWLIRQLLTGRITSSRLSHFLAVAHKLSGSPSGRSNGVLEITKWKRSFVSH